MHPIYSAYLYFCSLYKSLLLMEENKICKCCCSESGGEGGFCPSDVRWSRQSNQSLCTLVNTFRMILEKDTNSLRIPSSPAEPTRTSWTRKPVEVITECETGRDCLTPSSPNKMSAKSILHRTNNRIAVTACR